MAEEEDRWLFDPSEFPTLARDASGGVALAPLNHPLWTEHKAALILRYLRYFVYITKHGTYIDGFAGPQNDLPGMWAAELVVESEPRRLRHFHLVELDKEKIPALNALKAKADAVISPKRSIDIYQGDFNVVVDRILEAGTITPKEATFCLLDQWTFECHWATLEKLARYKPGGQSKIELFYFLSNSWLDRALAATKNEATVATGGAVQMLRPSFVVSHLTVALNCSQSVFAPNSDTHLCCRGPSTNAKAAIASCIT